MKHRRMRVFLVTCGCALAMAFAACGPARGADRVAAARDLFEAGKLAEALAGADAAIEGQPKDKAYALLLKGEIRCKLGELDLALGDFLAALECSEKGSPAQAGASANAALVLSVIAERRMFSGDGAGALSAAERAIALEPHYAPPWLTAGFVKSGFDEYEAAAADFKRYIELAPPSAGQEATARHMLGMIEWDSWNLPAAREHIRRAAELAPDNDRYRRDLEALDKVVETVERTAAAETRLAATVIAALLLWIAAGAAAFRFL